MPALGVLVALSGATSAFGTLGGLGGALFLVPMLILLGVEPAEAAPLGIVSVAAGSLAAGPRQLEEGTVHHRIGLTLEIAASAGAIGGALIGDTISPTVLTLALAAVAAVAGLQGLRQRSLRNLPRPEFTVETPGEWPGTLGGAYRLSPDRVVPYSARNVPAGMAAMVMAGLVSGLAGVGGGFIKTPAMSEIMGVPVKVAAATTTFTVGITATASIIVFAGQGRIDVEGAAAIVAGGLLGGIAGARLQEALPPTVVRRVLSIALLAVSVILVVVR